MNEGTIISKERLGCLSAPMSEREAGQFANGLERAVAGLQKG